MKRVVGLALCLCYAVLAIAQSGNVIEGTIIDSVTRENLSFVRVGLVIDDSLQRVVGTDFTGENGSFSLSGVTAGNYLLKLFLTGYDLQTLPLKIEANESVLHLGMLPLKKQSTQLGEVTVAAQKPVYMFEGEKTLYNVSEDPAVHSGSASDALQNAPGVEVDVEGNISLRGVSSVEIWINNKPSNMNEAALKNFIKELPAENIDRIEVITNPSARYSAKGKGGIINIVTNTKIKKNNFFSFGMNASSMPNLSPWLSYVWANNKWSFSLYAQYGYNESGYFLDGSDTKFSNEGDTASYTTLRKNHNNHYHSAGIFINSSCQIDSLNSLYMWAGAYPGWNKSTMADMEFRKEYLDMAGEYAYVTNHEDKTFNGGGYAGLWFTHQFDNEGHEISASAGANLYNSSVRGENFRFCPQAEELNYDRLHKRKNLSSSLDAALDYTIPYHPDGEISMGTNVAYALLDEMYRYDTLVRNAIDIYNLDSMRYKDSHIEGAGWDAYITLQHRFGRFTLKGGLRSEYIFYTHHYANSPKDNGQKSFWSLYPSLHLTYTTATMDNFKLSYTRRVNNPQSEELTTFIEYDDDSYSMGNPSLKPTYTHAIEAGWTRFIPKFGNVGINAYFNHSKNEYNELTDVAYSNYFGRIVSYSMPVNAGKSLYTGAELNVAYQLKTFMSLRFYATLHYMKSQFMFREERYNVENLGCQLRLNFWTKLWKVLEVNLSANYRSKTKTLFTTEKPFYSINGGLRVELWDRLLALHINVNNIFNWNRNGSISDNPYYQGTTTYLSRWTGRYVGVGITFRFGRMELESQAARNNVPTGEEMSKP